MDYEEEIKKLKFQTSILGETINFEEHPIARLVFEFDWDEEKLDAVYDCFERIEKILEETPNMLTHPDVEKIFHDSVGVGYQSLKAIILAFYRENRYTNVCIEYVKSLGEIVPIEYHKIQKDIISRDS